LTPLEVDEPTGLDEGEGLPRLLVTTPSDEDACGGCVELLAPPDVLWATDEVRMEVKLPADVVAGPVSRQEQAEDILEGESAHAVRSAGRPYDCVLITVV
jgi:hypothetical protein